MFYFYSVALYLCIIFPYTLNLAFNFRSVAPGFIIGQALIFIFSFRILKLSFSFKVFLAYSLFFLLFTLGAMWGEYYYQEGIFNSIVFFFCLILVGVNTSFLSTISLINESIFFRFITFSWHITSAIGLISLLIFHKYFIFFGEPSYYALFYGAFTLCYSVISGLIVRSLVALILVAIVTPVATISLFIPLLIMCHYSFKTVFIPAMALVFVVVMVPHVLGEYYSSRMTINVAQTNLSSLLFIANWLDVGDRIINFKLIGAGLGGGSESISSTNVYTESLVNRYEGSHVLSSGTFLSARLIQCFGLIGIIPIVAFIILLSKSYVFSLQLKATRQDKLSFAFLAALVPDLFFRTTGILSFSMFLYLFSLMYYFKKVTLQKKLKQFGRLFKQTLFKRKR